MNTRFRTRAKTPVGILRVVARLILEEPKRYDQTVCYSQLLDCNKIPRSWMHVYRESAYPACGTIGCIAGWVVLVTDGAIPPSWLHNIHGGREIMHRAADLLGLKWTSPLFSAEALRASLTPGTAAYARAGVAHIRRFVKKTWGKTL